MVWVIAEESPSHVAYDIAWFSGRDDGWYCDDDCCDDGCCDDDYDDDDWAAELAWYDKWYKYYANHSKGVFKNE